MQPIVLIEKNDLFLSVKMILTAARRAVAYRCLTYLFGNWQSDYKVLQEGCISDRMGSTLVERLYNP